MTNNTQFDHQDGGRNRKPGQRSRTTKLRAIGIAGAFLAFGALVTSDAADAAGYSQRNRAAPLGYGYNTQANPTYGFGPRVPVHPHDVVSGNRIIGRDPDPFIRGELLRHYNSGWPD